MPIEFTRTMVALAALFALGLVVTASTQAETPPIAVGSKFYIKASDAAQYLHSSGGSVSGYHETLHPCPKSNNHPNCQWILEPSTSTPGAFYIRISDKPLYLHALGGSLSGAHLTLHPCPKQNNHPNCQWIFERSTTKPGMFYIRSSDQRLYAHSHGGTKFGAHETLHPCPKGNNHPNCQWQLEGRASTSATPAPGASTPSATHSSASYPRGVGTIPNACPAGQEFEGLRCFDRCPAGYLGALDTCFKQCPRGFTEVGPTCIKPAPYERTPYLWNPFGDSQMTRCEATHGGGQCEWGGAVVYPKCEAGRSLIGWTTCSPQCPGDMTDIGAACTRPVTTRSSSGFATSCGSGRENNAGLCYPKCQSEFVGVGPVCWREVDPAKLLGSVLQWQQEWTKIESRYRPLIEVVSNHINRVSARIPDFPAKALVAYNNRDVAGLQRLLDFDTLRRDLNATGIINTNVSQTTDSATFVEQQPDTEIPDRLQTLIESGKMPVAPMSTGLTSRSPTESTSESNDNDPQQDLDIGTEFTGTKNETYTFSIAPLVLDVSLIGGATGEFGFAWELGNSQNYLYNSIAWTAGISAGIDGSFSLGLWRVAPADIDGPAAGFVLGVSYVGGVATAFWFNEDTGDFLGFVISPQVGLSAEAEFIRGTTDIVKF